MKKILSLLLTMVILVACMGAALSETEGYPYEFDGTLTYWIALNSNVAASEATLNTTPFAQYLIEETGINIEYIHPVVGSETEGFNLMLASGDLPDIIEISWADSQYYPAGLDAAIANGLVLNLNDYADQLPNYMKVLEENPEWKRMCTTDEGNLPGFYFMRGDSFVQVYAGMVLRQDWLDELGLEVPVTIDDWTNMLMAFRDEKGATTPLISRLEGKKLFPDMMQVSAFSGAYGVHGEFYHEDDVVKYGMMEEGWKQTLELFQMWYAEGLYNTDFTTDDANAKNAHVLNGDGGAFYGLTGSGIGVFMNSAREAGDEEFNLVAAPYPVLQEGDTPEFGQYDMAVSNLITTINPKSKNIDAALALLDYGYSEDGYNLFNFGREGESYDMIDGYPTFNDAVLNAEGLSIGNAAARYARSPYNGPFILGKEYQEQYFQLDIQRDAVNTWSATNMAAHKMPNISVAEADSEEYNKIIMEVQAFAAEYNVLAIIGEYDLANFQSEFVDVLLDIGIERAIEIQQAAYDAFLTR